MNPKYKFCTLFLLIFAAAMCCFQPARAIDFQVRHVSLDLGLSQTTVTAIVRDSRGFIWVGTQFGLNRDDRFRVSSYYHDPADPKSIPANSVAALFVDSRQRLWVACDEGVAIHNTRNNNFDCLTAPDGRRLFARSFLEEPAGVLMGGAGYFYFYDNATEQVRLIKPKGGSHLYYTEIIPWADGKLLLGTRYDGLWLYDRRQGTVQRFGAVPEREISALCLDSKGRLWLSPYGRGLRCLSRSGQVLGEYNTGNSPLTNNIILDILDYQGQIWLATDGGGINVYNPATKTFNPPIYKDVQEASAAVTTLYADGYGNMYAGTVHDGCMWVQRTAMRTFNCSGQNLKRWPAVSSLMRDTATGLVWCSMDGSGLMVHDERAATFDNVPSTAGLKVMSVASLNPAQLLVSTFDRGFHVLNKTGRTLGAAPATLTQLWQSQAHRALGFQLANLSDDAIAVLSDGLWVFRPSTGSLNEVTLPGPYRLGHMRLVYTEPGGFICMGYKGIYRYRQGQRSLAVLHHHEEGRDVTAATFDGRHYLYVAKTDLLLRIDLRRPSARPDTLNVAGMRRISAMVAENGRLWLGGMNQLFMLQADRNIPIVFNNLDGVDANEYQPSATLTTPQHIFMGGVNGLLRINRADIDSVLMYDPNIEFNLADIEIDGRSAYSRVGDDAVIDIPSSYSLLKLSIIDKERNTMRRKMYRYYIIGAGDTTCIETLDHSITLNRLTLGREYVVELSCRNNDGGWSAPQRVATLNVLAPVWRRWWAVLVYVLLLSAAVDFMVRRQRRKQQRNIERQVEATRSAALQKQVGFMVNTAHSLQTPLTLIYAPVKQLIERIEQGEQPQLVPELKSIYHNSKRMRDVINMALELHDVNAVAANSGRLGVHQLNDDVHEAVKAVRSEVDAKQLTIDTYTDATILPMVYDGARIGMALRILMQAAVRHSPDHGSIRVSTRAHDASIRIEICDSGQPLSADDEQQLFSQSFVSDHSTLGVGLEMAYVKSIVEERGGTLGVFNNPGGSGVTFWIELPKVVEHGQESTEDASTRSAMPAPSGQSTQALRMLDTSALTAVVAESDHDLCMFIAGQLKPYFRRVLHAFNGKDARLIVRQHHPDIVISGAMLPMLSGLDLCHEIKATPELNHIPVILLTTLRDGHTTEMCNDAGADYFIAKPFDMQVLLSCCRNLLNTRTIIKMRYRAAETTAEGADAPQPVQDAGLSNADETFLRKIDAIIADNLSSPDLNVDFIVAEMNMGRSSCYSRFKELTGKTIGGYINEFRLRRAKKLLANPGMSVNDIADLLGFGSQRYFSSWFKEKTTMSPSAFRQSLKE